MLALKMSLLSNVANSELKYVRIDEFLLQLVAYAPVILLVGLRFIVPESTRWLIAKGRNEEARWVLLHAGFD
jgi:hypothetical protein